MASRVEDMALAVPKGTEASGAVAPQLRSARRIAARAQALLAYVDAVVTVTDASGHLVYVSPSAQSLLGYSPVDLVRLGSLMTLVHPADAARMHTAYQQSVAGAGSTVATAFRARHRNGATLQLEATVTSLLHDPSVEGVVVNVRDAT